MLLTTEELGEFHEVTGADIDRILRDDSFGKFAVLSSSEGDFIQAGNDWEPSPECSAFVKLHGSDPWVLEYRDGLSDRLFRASGQITLDQVRHAFLSFLSGQEEWRQWFTWREQ
jgi:hypothetical protein